MNDTNRRPAAEEAWPLFPITAGVAILACLRRLRRFFLRPAPRHDYFPFVHVPFYFPPARAFSAMNRIDRKIGERNRPVKLTSDAIQNRENRILNRKKCLLTFDFSCQNGRPP